ncbi:MAG TPA: C45 family autoproteolytic acyltransferase/hydrolase [Ignavibacteriales bacterium]|nr:C45 family autoproteolytic acyltransferase/hydrolase [Ignavibacteriales bacterium]
MNRIRLLLLLSVLFLPLASGLLQAQAEKIQISNEGFEQKSSVNLPADWQTEVKGASQVVLDSKTVHEGSSSLFISNQDFSRTSVLSLPVKLKIGNLYRLSAWVKTENAYTNPNDQYPTPVAACISMQSFPFTNHSPALGSTSEWQKIETIFIATTKEDRISLNLGYNGGARGNAWFDDVRLEEVNDISEYIPMETVRWYGKAFRFEDKGWVFLHIEGEPYQRGFQYGYLAADEIKEFITKLAIKKNTADPQAGWKDIRFSADAIMLRRYEEEYLTEMKGIADGAGKAGIKLFGKNPDLIDIVALNSSIDIDYAGDALHNTPNPLTGKSFLAAEDELTIQDKLHKCSSFLATKSATKDNRVVFGQIFMWNGYTGPHWNFFVDVVPSKGNRLVYETYPGGIHSGADFYINSAGITIGETTVSQTPFNPDGIPQSDRIRKAAQYAKSIDDVVSIMTTKNNGLYTNDWLIADTKTDEIAVLALGTNKYQLWRSSKKEFYGNQKDWYWSDNNVKSLDVRKEYVVNDDNAPYDLAFRPVNRDLAFTKFYEENYGKIDANKGINLWNSSPINRPHACDGKVTTSEMAEHMMFFANYGKVTLRETFINENGRVPDLPGAIPHLSLGYTVINPVLFTEKLTELHQKEQSAQKVNELSPVVEDVKEDYTFDKAALWHNTVYPSSDKVNWFISGTAAYWNLLNSMPSNAVKASNFVKDELAELNSRLLYTMQREGTIAPDRAETVYTEYKQYQIPRIRGTYLLHQLRLLLGNDTFRKAMNKFHDTFKEKEITEKDFLSTVESVSGKKLDSFISQWISRSDLPELKVMASSSAESDGWNVTLTVNQSGKPYHFISTVMIETAKEQVWKKVEVTDQNNTFSFRLKDKPEKLTFNAGNDIPVEREYIYTFSNFTDDFSTTLIVYGTASENEANHTLAQRFQKMAADKFTEVLLPIKKDNEADLKELSENDLVILGSASENGLMKNVAEKLGLKAGKNVFNWNGKVYGSSDDGLFAAYPNPYNPKKTVYLFISNSALELYHMTKNLYRMPQWAVFKKDQIVEKGYHVPSAMQVTLTGNTAQ